MKLKNVWKEVLPPLESHSDLRGRIVDIFYDHNIDHVAIIDSAPQVLRGNHYHKESTQHMLMIKGSLEYWYKPLGLEVDPQMIIAKEGDLVSTPPYEVHALVIREEGNQFIVFSEGVRGGTDYESDTFRVDNIVPKEKLPKEISDDR